MDEFTKEVVITALKNMFKSTYFSICTIDKCLKLTSFVPDAHDYEALSALHCINWMNMSPELCQEAFNKTVSMFQSESLDLGLLDMLFDEKKGRFEIKQTKRRVFGLLK